jgi:hypothetical protein
MKFLSFGGLYWIISVGEGVGGEKKILNKLLKEKADVFETC